MLTALALAAVLAGSLAADGADPAGPEPRTATPRAEAAPRPATAPEPRGVTAPDVLAAVAAARGKVVLVNAWATWCVPCRKEMPDLLKLRRELGPRGFELVLVTTDFAADLPRAREFLGGLGVDFTTLWKRQADQEFIDTLDPSWSGALPFTILYDRNGARRESWQGQATHDQLVARVAPLLDEKGPRQ